MPRMYRARDGQHRRCPGPAWASRLRRRSRSIEERAKVRCRIRSRSKVDTTARAGTMKAPVVDLTFPHAWTAEILPQRPLILPKRQFVYPRKAEEVERGALEVMVHPADAEPFLATCALGFADPAAPSGVWSCPDPAWLCAVAGGYAYLLNTTEPQQFEQVEYRPVLDVRPLPEQRLLLFTGHHSLLAWGAQGKARRRRGSPGRALRLPASRAISSTELAGICARIATCPSRSIYEPARIPARSASWPSFCAWARLSSLRLHRCASASQVPAICSALRLPATVAAK